MQHLLQYIKYMQSAIIKGSSIQNNKKVAYLFLEPLIARKIGYTDKSRQRIDSQNTKTSLVKVTPLIKKKYRTEEKQNLIEEEKAYMPSPKSIFMKKGGFSLELKSSILKKQKKILLIQDNKSQEMEASPIISQNNFFRKNYLRTLYNNKYNNKGIKKNKQSKYQGEGSEISSPQHTVKNDQKSPIQKFEVAPSGIFLEKYKNKLSEFEREQIKNLDVVFYLNRRRSKSLKFDDDEGDLKVYSHDHVNYRYEVFDILGKGSFGQVFKVFDHKKKEYVALKIIKNKIKYTHQAQIEIKLLRFISNNDLKEKSNIIKMKESFSFRQHMCITFELLHHNLYDFMKENAFRGLSAELIRRFAIQILQCLLFFQKHRIIHCDMKPENILLKQPKKSGIKIIDLGSSCFENEILYTYIQSRFYRAPQIILGIEYTTAIDIWSFGCMLVEFDMGYPIFPGENENQQMALFMQILGIPHRNLLERGSRSKRFFDENYYPRPSKNSKGKIHRPNSKPLQNFLSIKDKDFLDLIKKCLQWDPTKRIRASQALLHPWIVNALPNQIKQQHIQQMKLDAPYLFKI